MEEGDTGIQENDMEEDTESEADDDEAESRSNSTASSDDPDLDNYDQRDRILAKFKVGDAVLMSDDPPFVSKNLARVWFVDELLHETSSNRWILTIARKQANIWIDGKNIEIGRQHNDDSDGPEEVVVDQDSVERIV